ncbi:anti-sigma-K factor RskA [Gordonia effusa NBRC 100432]|uniref:Regulator of SigK n=1 Tax=Gordonia effusa NBRC 100432 TaxID=1077974 RepID=H0R6X2_9ACTN|nr:anti-sigma factor [Gordonia effusa]GAB20823.1 anti-sigma-K factor RskA [Gordonia effusa NBRC 100432]
MPELSSEELVDLAEVYALDALDDAERRDISIALAAAAPDVRRRFESVVTEVRETLAAHSATLALAPPARAYESLMAEVAPASVGGTVTDLTARRRRLYVALAAAAAVVAVVLGGIGIASRLGQSPTSPPSAAEQLMSARDLRTSTAAVPGGGTMTVLYSRSANSAVVVLNDVPAPAAQSAYQMWQIPGAGAPKSLGVMDAAAITPSTQVSVPNIEATSAISVSVEPPGGSSAPTKVVVSVPLRE